MTPCQPARCAAVAFLLAAPASIAAQLPELRYAPDLTIDVTKEGIRSVGPLIVSNRGKIIVHEVSSGQLIEFDSLGRKHPWPLQIGRRSAKSDIAWVANVGWVGGGDSMWITDPAFNQLAVIDANGKLVKSIERPSWVRPFWRDRRKYPLFRGLTWLALYPDGSTLVAPSQRRALFDAPEYDRSKLHLLRVNADGKILRTVARVAGAVGERRLLLRDGMERTAVGVPFFAKTVWKVSTDGQRIVIVQPLITASDSGAFVVTALNADGHTVFSRRYTVETKRVPTDQVETTLTPIKPFGRYTAEWIRDTIRKQVPVFESRVANVSIGIDHSVWVWLRSSVPESRGLVFDAKGEPAGTVVFPFSWKLGALGLDRIWTTQRIGPATNPKAHHIVRLSRVTATAAQPSRSASASASPQRSRSRQ